MLYFLLIPLPGTAIKMMGRITCKELITLESYKTSEKLESSAGGFLMFSGSIEVEHWLNMG